MGRGSETTDGRRFAGRLAIAGTIGLIAALTIAALLLALGVFAASASAQSASEGASTAPVTPQSPWRKPDPLTALSRIAFGSCLDQAKPQPIWQPILAARPDLFLMLGDNVYGDIKSADRRELIAAYTLQASHPELAAARAAFPFLATWDDHDFGLNDGGGTFPHKRESAELFRTFWQQPDAAGDGRDGIYFSRIVGPEGRRVQVLMLDTRSFRSDLKRKGSAFPHWGRYEPTEDTATTILGPAQWAWLEGELRKPADIRLLVSSVQVLADGHGFERWGNFPHEQARLLQLIRDTGAKGVILLSGDRHSGAIYRQTAVNGEIAYPLVEITSSSMNRSYGPSRDARLPPLVTDIFHVENYGVLDIDWQGRAIIATLADRDGAALAAIRIAFSEIGL